MVLLRAGTLTPEIVFTPESMRLDLQERDGSATMQLKAGATPALSVGDWLKDDTEPGKGIIWRVSGVDTDYNTQTRRITLEHFIHVLDDYIVDAEYEWAGISCADAARAVLEWNPWWRLGACDYGVSLPYSFNGDSVMEAMETISDTLEDCEWEFDMSAIPFRISLKRPDTSIKTEMRCGRNLKTLKRNVSRKGMYTRFYPIGENDLRIPGRYVSRNEDLYGTICKTETESGYGDAAMLRAWAEGRLRQHCQPSVTITATGMSLSQATGEPLDRLGIGRRCRIPLPEYGTTIVEKITQLSWNDKIGNPEGVTVTLASNPKDVASIFRSESTSASRGGRSGAKKAKEDHAWFTDTEDHVSMTAEAILGKDASGNVNWSRMADITVNGNGIYSTVTETKGDMVVAKSSIKQLKDSIDATVTAVGKDGKITAASICLAIRNGSSEAYISADRIRLDGNTSIRQLLTGQATVGQLKVSDLRVQAQGGMGFISVANCINTAVVSNNELKLYRMNGELVATFSKATTQDGAWSGNITAGKSYKVEAKQNGRVVHTHYSPALDGYYTGTKSWASDYKSVDVPVTVYDENGTDLFRDTLNIDTSTAWQRGHDSAYPNSRSLTYNRSETLPSGTTRYHYYTTGSPIHTSGSLTVHW